MYSIFIVSLTFLVLTINGQDCGQKFANFKTCVKGAIETSDQQPDPKLSGLKTGVDKCYKDAHCTAVPDDSSEEDEKEQARQNQTDCRKQYRAEALKQIEACIKKSYPQFSLPQKPQTPGRPNEGRHLHPKRLDDSCKNGGDKTAAQACLKTLFVSNKPSEADLKQKFDAACAKVNDCKKQLTGCETQIADVKAKLCQCAKDVHAKAATIRQGIKSCDGLPQNAHQRPGQAASKGPSDCEEVETDRCEKGFDAFKQKHFPKPN